MQILLPVFLLGIVGFYEFPSSKRKIFAIVYCFVLAVVAFSWQPHTADDLFREYQNLEGIRQYGWKYFSMKESEYYVATKFDGLYLTQLYYYLFAQLPVNNFLPAVTTFIVYYLQFSIIEKISARYELSKLNTFVLYAFVLCTRETYMIMSGIRNQLAFSVAGYFLYKDLIENRNKIKCFIVYFLMIFVHQSAIFIIAFRMLCLIQSKRIKAICAFVALFWSIGLDTLNSILSRWDSLLVIRTLLYKINIYTVDNGGNSANIILRTRYLIYMLSWIPIVLLLVYTVFYLKRNLPVNSIDKIRRIRFGKGKLIISRKSRLKDYSDVIIENNEMGWFVLFNACFTIGSYMYYWLYLRAASILGIIGVIPITGVLKLYSDRNRVHSKNNYILFVMVMCLIKFLITMFYMNRNMDFGFTL